ncbi:HD domain-containing phosphohydrolase [Longimicrobium sp.]|uniref:HD domain-containing phosphohydrolase n=1 Tax=Longimicrobium sp. TaxID=2029185 RepID=UPI002ED797DD
MFSRSPAQPSPAAGARDPLPRFVQQAESLRESGDLDRAEEMLVRGLRDHGGDPRARAALARVLADRGDTERAEGVWRDVLGLDPDYVPALRALADISEAAGRRDEAMGFFRRLIRVENAGFDFGHAGQEAQPAASDPFAASPASSAAANVPADPAIDPDADPAEVLRAASRAWEAERAATGDEPSADAIPSFTPDEREVEQAGAPLSFTPDDVDARHSHVRPSFTGDEPAAAPPPATLAFTADEQDVAHSGAAPSFAADEPDAVQGRFSQGDDPTSGQSREAFAAPSFSADEPDAAQGRFSQGDDPTSGQSRDAFVAPSFTADGPHAEQSPFMRAADPSPQAHDVAPVPIAFHADAALQGAVGDSADFAEAEFDEWDDDEALAGFDIVFMDEDDVAEAEVEETVAAAPLTSEPLDEAVVVDAAPLASEPVDEAASDEAPDAAAVIEAVASAEGVDESAWSDESFAPAESSAVDATETIEAVEGIDEAAWSDEAFAPAEAGEDGFGPGFELPAIPVAEPAAFEEVAESDEALDAVAEEGSTTGVADADEAVDADVNAGAFAEAAEPVSAAADADAFPGGITEADEPISATTDAYAFAGGIPDADEPVSAAADADAYAGGIVEADEPVSAAVDADAFAGGSAGADDTVSAAEDVAATADAMDAVEASAAEPEPEPIADWLRAIDDADPTIAVVPAPYVAAPDEDDRADEVDLAEAVDYGDEVDPAAAVDFADLSAPIGANVEPVDVSATWDVAVQSLGTSTMAHTSDADQPGDHEPAAPVDFADHAEPIGAHVEPMDASVTADVDVGSVGPSTLADTSDADQPGEPAAGYVFDDVVAGDPEALDAVEAYAAPAADEDAELEQPVDVGTAAPDAPPVDAGGWPTRARLPHGVTLDPEPSPLAAPSEPPAPIATPQARPAPARPAASLANPEARPADAPNFPPALPPDPAVARAWFDRATQRAPQEPKAAPAPSVALVAAAREPWAPAPTLTGRANPVQLAQALVRVLERDGDVLGAASSVRRLLAVSIGRELGMEGTRLDGLALAAVLADLGGLFLRGGGQAQRGTDVSLTLMESVPLTPEVHEALSMQHRRWDGSDGGPREDGIPFPARVLAVARDAASLLTGSSRRGTDAAVHELQRGAGTTYDPMVVSVLRRVLARRELYGIGYGVGGRVMVAHRRELRSMDLAGRLHASGFEAETPGAGTLRQRLHGDLPLALIVGAELAASEADTLRELRAIPAAAWMPVVVVDADDAEVRPSLLAAGADLCFASSATFTEVGAALNALLRRLSTLAGGTAE